MSLLAGLVLFNILALCLNFYSSWKNRKFRKAFDHAHEEFFNEWGCAEIQDILCRQISVEAKEKFDQHYSEIKRQIIYKKAHQRVDEVAEEWCKNFTLQNYDELVKEKLKDDVKIRLNRSFHEQGDISEY